jgi:hypothetical protein
LETLNFWFLKTTLASAPDSPKKSDTKDIPRLGGFILARAVATSVTAPGLNAGDGFFPRESRGEPKGCPDALHSPPHPSGKHAVHEAVFRSFL